MKVSKEKLAENRVALVDAAVRLIQERGFDGAGVVDIGKAAGLTQGGIYGQFGSKGALAAEACRRSHAEGLDDLASVAVGAEDELSAYVAKYLGDDHVFDVAQGCPMAAYTSEVPRQSAEVQREFVGGYERVVDLFETTLRGRVPGADARRRALALVASMAGSVAMARAVQPTSPALAGELLEAARDELERLAISAVGTTP